MILRVSVEKSK